MNSDLCSKLLIKTEAAKRLKDLASSDSRDIVADLEVGCVVWRGCGHYPPTPLAMGAPDAQRGGNIAGHAS